MTFFKIFVPFAFLICLICFRKIPKIGGNIYVAFLGAGIMAYVLGGNYNISNWGSTWISNINTYAFPIIVVILGSIFSSMLNKMGALEDILSLFRSLLGKSVQGMVVACLITLWLGGALIGNTCAVAMVIGILVIPLLLELGISGEIICAILSAGATLGAIQPPVSGIFNLSISLMGIEGNKVLMWSYLTITIGLVVTCLFFSKVYIGKKYTLPDSYKNLEKPSLILKRKWKSFIAPVVLFTLAIIASIPGIALDVAGNLLKLVANGKVYAWMEKTPIISGLVNYISLDIIVAMLVIIVMRKDVRIRIGNVVLEGIKTSYKSALTIVCMAFFVGGLNGGGQINLISDFTKTLSPNMFIIIGGFMLMIIGMLTGAAGNGVFMLFPVLVPALLSMDISANNICLGLTHLAFAGQGMPPTDSNVFIISSFVGDFAKQKINPQKVMIMCLPYTLYLTLVGFLFLFIK